MKSFSPSTLHYTFGSFCCLSPRSLPGSSQELRLGRNLHRAARVLLPDPQLPRGSRRRGCHELHALHAAEVRRDGEEEAAEGLPCGGGRSIQVLKGG